MKANSQTKPLFDRIAVPKTYDILADRLRKTILDGELDVGTRLPTERELVDQTGLSRGSVREALRKLEVEGLITPRPGRFGGNIVSRPNNDAMAHFMEQFVRSRRLPLESVYETRETIEPALARSAATGRTAEDIARLRSLNDQLRTISDPGDFAAIYIEWHNVLAVASQNEFLAALFYAISFGVFVASLRTSYDSPEIRAATCKAHDRIIDAIVERDGDAAFRRLERHLKAVRVEGALEG